MQDPDHQHWLSAVGSDPPPQSAAYRIFVGPQGLRAGWSVLLFISIFSVLSFPLQVAQLRLLPQPAQMTEQQPLMTIVPEAGTLLILVLATFIMARIEGRPFLFYGFSGPRKFPLFLWGLLSGAAVISAFVLFLKSVGLLVFDGSMLRGGIAWKYAAAWGAGFLLVALVEESMSRGYIQFALARGIGFWWAALVWSAAFGLIHLGNPGESPVGIFCAGAIGFILCLSLWLTKSLWWAVGMHMGWDWAQSYVYGVADSGMIAAGHLFTTHPAGPPLWSGGSVGPEGSIYAIPLTLLMAAGTWLALKPDSRDTEIALREAA